MKPPTEEQIKLRSSVIDFLQGGNDFTDGMVIGFSLVVELVDRDGARNCVNLSADAAGRPLPYHAIIGHVYHLDNEAEFDEEPEDDD